MVTINFNPKGGGGYISDPITAADAEIVVHLEFAVPATVALEQSITGDNFVEAEHFARAYTFERSILYHAGQQIRFVTSRKPVKAVYIE